MSEYCSYCGVFSRDACSDYKHQYLAQELKNCLNLDENRRSGALHSAGFYSEADAIDNLHELAEYRRRFGPL